MLSVQSPAQLNMSPTDPHDAGNWSSWRAASALQSDLPTPPSSVPPRCSKTLLNSHLSAQAHEQHHHLTLPPIAHLDRHWPCSPLTPPDDEMHSSPLWRDSKPGPSRLHSPLTTNPSPLLASPSPSPIDEDDEHYYPMDEQQDEIEPVRQEWEWEWQQQQWQQQREGQDDQQPQQQAEPYAYPEPSLHLADWVTDSQKRSARFIAEKTCEMVCYLWFSSSLGPSAAAASRHRRERERERRRAALSGHGHGSPPFASRPLSNARTASLQFCASSEFVAFMQKLLETTQVSQSVIVLSLHYIFRLKERNDFSLGRPGSEFRVAVCALMLANKFVDDNTYTNKTWSEVSSIPLDELNKMEREFLLGVDFRLFVDEPTYDSWLNLLKGLVLAKEREHQRWRMRRHALMLPCVANIQQNGCRERNGVQSGVCANGYEYTTQIAHRPQQQRARSTSPHRSRNYSYAPAYPFTFSVPSQSHVPEIATSQSAQTSPMDRYGARASSKRSAADAFSPTSATFEGVGAVAPRPLKRPTGLALDIGAALASAHSHAMQGIHESVSAHSGSYADSLRGLERMSIASSSGAATPVESGAPQQQPEQSHTLAAAYRVEHASRRAIPQHLYFYTLASSPMCAGSSSASVTSTSTSSSVAPPMLSEGRVEGADEIYPPGADRKTRLRYSRVPVQADEGYRHGYTVGNYGLCYSSAAYRNYGQQQQLQFADVLAHPTSAHSSTSSSSSSSAYMQPVCAHPASQALPQHHYQHHQQQHLPPLALALNLPPPTRVSQTQSARTSPLPSFAHAYGVVPVPGLEPVTLGHPSSACASAGYAAPPPTTSAWSAPPSESVDGVYAPPSHTYHHHVHRNWRAYTHLHPPAPEFKHMYTPPTHAYATHLQVPGVTATSLAVGHTPAPANNVQLERAAFANAGPPGVAHFYSGAPYTALRSASSGRGYAGVGAGARYGAGLSSGAASMQSQSVNASPSAYTYAVRDGRL